MTELSKQFVRPLIWKYNHENEGTDTLRGDVGLL